MEDDLSEPPPMMLLSDPPDFDPVAVIDAIEEVSDPRLLSEEELPKPLPKPGNVPPADEEVTPTPNGEEKGSG